MGKLLRALFRLPMVIIATYAAQQVARARRPDLGTAVAGADVPPVTERRLPTR